jgi:iron complex outermembrane receptor protein
MKTLFASLALFGLVGFVQAQNTEPDSVKQKEVKLKEVVVSSSRASSITPVTFVNFEKADIAKVNLGQDLPVLLNYLPAVVSTTFDGTGVGYTDYRIRGADNSRINVTINGIPYNDADSQTTFFVNLQDFASSIENIQIQRGVGTSTNGAGAFGASINILTDRASDEAFASVSTGIGSFGTNRQSIKFGTGALGDGFSFSGRLSRIASDGYVDRATSELKSYFLQGDYVKGETRLQAITFGGTERTGLSFFGLDQAGLDMDRRMNFDGIYFDRDGNQQIYQNQTDNYAQNHFHLHWNQGWNSNWRSQFSLHYTQSAGFFEQMNDDASLSAYRLDDFTFNGEAQTTADLATQAHLNSDFYGGVFSLTYQKDQLEWITGGSFNYYDGIQFGEIVSADLALLPERPFRFYENTTVKTDLSVYSKANFELAPNLNGFADLQFRRVDYEASGALLELGAQLDVDETYNFFNPKAGLSYQLKPGSRLYLSWARSHREPARVDFENGSPEAERLDDFELGWRTQNRTFQLGANVYYMLFNNQLVLTGALDEVGFPIRQNSGKSYRLGIELDAQWQPHPKWTIAPNVALSENKNQDFITPLDGTLQNLGDTDISFSPSVVAGNRIEFRPDDSWSFTLFSKYVGEQFMSNTEAANSRLESYFVQDLNLQYQTGSFGFVKKLVLQGQINNLLDLEYENNGYYFTFDVPDGAGGVSTLDGNGFYPQAGINFLLGATLHF